LLRQSGFNAANSGRSTQLGVEAVKPHDTPDARRLGSGDEVRVGEVETAVDVQVERPQDRPFILEQNTD
jgi:hypothetical protein